jgi:hypothetical protein
MDRTVPGMYFWLEFYVRFRRPCIVSGGSFSGRIVERVSWFLGRGRVFGPLYISRHTQNIRKITSLYNI